MRRSRRGNYLVPAAIAFPVVFGFSALAIDSSRVVQAQVELEASSDAVAHAALVSIRNGALGDVTEGQLQQFYGLNSIDGRSVVERNMDVEPGNWNFVTQTFTPYTWDDIGYAPVNAVRATGSRKGSADALPMYLSPFMGVEMMDIQTHQASIAAYQTTDLMVVLDVTPSFVAEMAEAKEASLAMLQYMNQNNIEGSRIGMVTFTGGAEVFSNFYDPVAEYEILYSQWEGTDSTPPNLPDTDCSKDLDASGQWIVGSWNCYGPSFVSDGSSGEYSDPVPVQNTNFKLKRGIAPCSVREWANESDGYDPNGYIFKRYGRHGFKFKSEDVVPCGKGGGGTNPGAGLDVALDEMLLHAGDSSHWEMMLITDGEPYYDNTGFNSHHTYPRWDMRGHAGSHLGVQAYTKDMAEEACSKGIDVNAIFFSKDAETISGRPYSVYGEWLDENVVCDRPGSHFSETVDIEKLDDLMTEIVSTLPIILVQ